MEQEARLLEAFASLPTAGRAWAFPAATHDGVRVSLQLSQRNLPANAQRKYLTSFLLNEAVLEAGEPDVSLPVEQSGVLLYAPSPSGRRAVVVRSGGADASAGALVPGRRAYKNGCCRAQSLLAGCGAAAICICRSRLPRCACGSSHSVPHIFWLQCWRCGTAAAASASCTCPSRCTAASSTTAGSARVRVLQDDACLRGRWYAVCDGHGLEGIAAACR